MPPSGCWCLGVVQNSRGEQGVEREGEEGEHSACLVAAPRPSPSLLVVGLMHGCQPPSLPQRELDEREGDGWKHLPLCGGARDGPSSGAPDQISRWCGQHERRSLDLTSSATMQRLFFFQRAVKFSLGLITCVLKFCAYFVQS